MSRGQSKTAILISMYNGKTEGHLLDIKNKTKIKVLNDLLIRSHSCYQKQNKNKIKNNLLIKSHKSFELSLLLQREERVFTRNYKTINNAYVKDPPTATAATIYRMHTPTNLPFATRFCFEHFCFTSHLHQLTTSRGIKLYLFHFAVITLCGFKPRAHITKKNKKP